MFSPKLQALLLATGAAFVVAVPASGDPETQVTPVAHNSKPLVKKCEASQAQHRRYTTAVYKRARIAKRSLKRLDRLRACALSAKASKNMLAFERKARASRRARRAMLCGLPPCNKRLLDYMAVQRYGRAGANCLHPIIRHESGYNHRIGYGGYIGPPGRVAWGLPQALPPQKMASAGADWATNPRTQIKWLLNYVMRYGGPCGALAKKRASGWY